MRVYYKKENRLDAIILVLLIVLLLAMLFFLITRQFELLLLSTGVAALCYFILNYTRNYFVFDLEKKTLSRFQKKKLIGKEQIAKTQFSWHYVPFSLDLDLGTPNTRGQVTFHTRLVCIIELTSSEKIRIYQERWQWHSLPQNWGYQEELTNFTGETILVRKGLLRLKEDIENTSWK